MCGSMELTPGHLKAGEGKGRLMFCFVPFLFSFYVVGMVGGKWEFPIALKVIRFNASLLCSQISLLYLY